MARGWLGAGFLAFFLLLSILISVAMDNAHLPNEKLLEQAAETALTGDFQEAVSKGMAAKTRWEQQWNGTATVADHSPMDTVDALFAEMEIYARTEEKPHFAACCQELAQQVGAVAEAHRFRWWNIL